MSNQAAVYPTAKSRFEVRNIEKYKPEKDEVLIKVCYAATNPVDWKIQKHGVFVKNFPTVLSSDVSGVIEEVGEGVDPTFVGQKVWAYLPLIATNFNIRNGGFQQFTVCPKSSVCKLPDNLSMEEGSTLGLAGATAGIGLFYDLQIPKPTEHEKKEIKGDILLVWGGSSAVGGYAVQLASLAGLTVFAVNSPKNFDLVKKFRASEAFDYHDPEITAKIKKAGGGKIKWVFNSISC